MKQCRDCGASKPLSQFHRRRDRADGRRDECMECMRRRSKGYWHNNGVDRRHYVTNKDAYMDDPAAWAETAPEAELLRMYRDALQRVAVAEQELTRRGWRAEHLQFYRE